MLAAGAQWSAIDSLKNYNNNNNNIISSITAAAAAAVAEPLHAQSRGVHVYIRRTAAAGA